MQSHMMDFFAPDTGVPMYPDHPEEAVTDHFELGDLFNKV